MSENNSKPVSSISRKERRLKWWSEHQPEQAEAEKSEEPVSKKPTAKKDGVDAVPVKKKPTATTDSVDALSSSKPKNKKAKKFYVLFVGQIPYSASEEDITKHFSKAGELKSVRLATHKDTGKSRGFGYVEFSNNKSYMNGLNMHLSKLHRRPINVEITSPGRGTSLFRKENLKRKNEEMAKFRGLKEEGATGGAMRIPAPKPTQGNKKKKFGNDDR